MAISQTRELQVLELEERRKEVPSRNTHAPQSYTFSRYRFTHGSQGESYIMIPQGFPGWEGSQQYRSFGSGSLESRFHGLQRSTRLFISLAARSGPNALSSL